jgi:energy-coupling factor transporter ATP-binding protein EcfA2
MKNEYGLRKLVLINSANYEIAEIPLDDAVSIVGPNNSGKTSLINALQFLLIRDKQQMDFGAHDRNSSLKFYFPYPSSYILLEMQLKSGVVVVGCVGKGFSNEYQYFSYEGSLHIEDYKDVDGSIIEEAFLQEKMREKGISINKYPRSTEFFNNLYGKTDLASSDLDIRLFSVAASLRDVFQKVLIKTLHLDKLDSADIKRFLLQINAVNYSKEASSRGFDFKREWNEAFQSVEEDKAQYKACKDSMSSINDLERRYNRIRELRGKIGTMRPLINEGLSRWEEYKNSEDDRLKKDLARVQAEIAEYGEKHDQIIRDNEDINRNLGEIESKNNRYESLKSWFVLNIDENVLKQNLSSLNDQVAAKQTLLNSTRQENVRFISGRIKELEEGINQSLRELESGEKLFKRQVQSLLNSEEKDILYNLANQRILSLSVDELGDVRSFIESYKTWLNSQGDILEINGLTLNRCEILAMEHYEEKSPEEIQEEINLSKDELEKYKERRRAIEEREKVKNELSALIEKRDSAQKDLNDYNEFVELRLSVAERNSEKIKLSKSLQENLSNLEKFDKEKGKSQTKEREIIGKINDLNKRNDDISLLRNKRRDVENYADVLEQVYLPYVYDGNVMEELPELLKNQVDDCNELDSVSSSKNRILRDLEHRGFTKFIGIEQEDEMTERILDYAQTLPKEEAAIQRNLHVAITRVGNILIELVNQYKTFEDDLTKFNVLITKRRVSDLKKLSIEINPRDILDAVKIIARHSAYSADSMGLFSPDAKEGYAGNPEVDKAKEKLCRFCDNNDKLRLENLFDLSIKVQKEGELEQNLSDLHAIGSNGTVLMAKLIFGLALLHWMTDKKNATTSICYLDEAASIDEENQKKLIAAAREFGFVLLFASPTAQTTVRYCIRIEKRNNRNVVTDKQRITLDPIEVRNEE